MERRFVFLKSLMLNAVALIILTAPAIQHPSARAAEFMLSPPQSIQAAIDEAEDNDIIILGTGTYSENINFSGKAVTIKSNDPNNWDVVTATIIDGNQTGSVVTFHSGEESESVLCGITIRNGKKDFGGGIYCDSSSPSISNCLITENSGDWGGGICCDYSSSPSIINCVISNNSAIHNDGNGGGLYCFGSSEPSIVHCTITLNSSGWGGGICCDYSAPVITDCTLSDNSTACDGGGIYGNSSAMTISHSTITGNSGDWGGGICCDYSAPIITHCIIAQNSVLSKGGGMYCESSLPYLRNCTLRGNSASDGGGIECFGSSPYIVNSIFRENGSEIHAVSGSHPKLSYCNIQGGYQGLGNIDTDQCFTGPDNYSLSPDSPCVDAGHPRIYDSDASRSDMGSYGGEGGFDSNSITITVDKDGSGDYECIQDAVYYAVPGDTVTVFPGTYTENVVLANKNIFLISNDGKDSTLINGSFLGSVLYLSHIGSDTRIDGFTIQNGGDWFAGEGPEGGGISCRFCSSPFISNCLISHNHTSNDGGGIYCDFSSPNIHNCTIIYNTGDWGGGICCDYTSSPNISNCIIKRNEAFSGGGIEFYYSFPSVANCLISENFAEDDGGGIYCSSSSPTISNCIITDNEAARGGGMYCDYTSSASLTNCTMSGNTSSNEWGGGIEVYDSSVLIITNCILWGNSPEEIYLSESDLIATYSDIQGWNITDSDNINVNPLFTDPDAGNFHLISDSPCIDSGDADSPTLPSIDKDGNPRIINGKPDMGAYEYIEWFTLHPGLNLVSFPQGLKRSSLQEQNFSAIKIVKYQPETKFWSIVGPSDDENFSLSLENGWLIYLNQEEPGIDLYFPDAGSIPLFDPNTDLVSGLNLLTLHSVSEIINRGNDSSQPVTWPENFFENVFQETGKELASSFRYDCRKGKWQADYQFFGRTAGPGSELKKEGYILYLY